MKQETSSPLPENRSTVKQPSGGAVVTDISSVRGKPGNPRTSQPETAHPPTPETRVRPAILIVEDEILVARDLQQSLQELGYNAYAIAASSEEAVAASWSQCPDIVLMDIRLKGAEDGIAVAAVLQEKFQPAVIYLTAHADAATLDRARKTSPYGYLPKPVTITALRSMIEITLSRRELDRAREKAAALAAHLQQSEEQFRQLAENIQDVFFILLPDFSKMIYTSPAFEQIWGRPYDTSNPMDWASSIHPDDHGRIMDQLTRQIGKPVIEEFEFRIIRGDGAVRWIFARHFPLYDATGKPYRLVGVATDITARKLAEAKVQHLNRVYAVLSGINALIIRAQTQGELFSAACRLAIEQGDFTLAWIGWLEDDQDLVTPLAWSGKDGVDQMIEHSVALSIGEDTLEALRRREPWMSNDLGTMDLLIPYHESLLDHGMHSVVTLPLAVHERIVGCLVLATQERASFDEAEMRLLTELAGDVSFALDHIEKTEKLNYLAYYDPLTGLANRNLFLERLAHHIHTAERTDGQFAIVVRDPERFEIINETFGRAAGDVLLKEMADRLSRCEGNRHCTARIGSDQFASILPYSGGIENIERLLEEQFQQWLGAPFKMSDHEVRLTGCAGVALYPRDGRDPESLLKNAEAARKRAGSPGDRTVFFSEEIGNRIAERLSMETRMRRALENREFVLHYQQKVNLDSRHCEGLEALIRWQSPDLGLVAPAKFIPLLEETGMIVEVGAWVLLQACSDRAAWLEQGLKAPRVAVNVSSVQLRSADFLATVRAALKRATRNAVLVAAADAGLDIEVTESLFVEHLDTTLEKLRALRSLGIGVDIDDFGTGYSCLGYLAKLPVTTLKIDRSFTAAMLDDPSVTTLVSTIITLAHSLKLKVVAEGVESEEQAKILRLLRCDQMQGYLIGKPLPFEAITEKLARST